MRDWNRITGVLLLSAVLGLAGCAQSPQQVTLAPELEPAESAVAEGRRVWVSAEDARESPVLGSRGGVYGDTANLTLRNDLADVLSEAAAAQLRSLGFSASEGSGEGIRFRVIADVLEYRVLEEVRLGREVEVATVLRAEVRRGNETYSGRYRVRTKQRYPASPTAAQNERLVNSVVAEALKRLFADEKLQRFMVEN